LKQYSAPVIKVERAFSERKWGVGFFAEESCSWQEEPGRRAAASCSNRSSSSSLFHTKEKAGKKSEIKRRREKKIKKIKKNIFLLFVVEVHDGIGKVMKARVASISLHCDRSSVKRSFFLASCSEKKLIKKK
jgi:hypothetical protein